MMSRATVVLNPTAGRDAGARLAAQIDRQLRKGGLDFELVRTAGPGHATVLACDAVREGKELVVAVGGDGTVNEVLNGLFQDGAGPNGTALAVLPIGTGNDFAYGAGVRRDLAESCRMAIQGDERVLDVGRVEADNEGPRYFGNGVGIGFDAIVNIESRKLTRLRGFQVYLVAVLRTLISYYEAPQTLLTIDGQEIAQPSLMISVMNGCRFGGGFEVAPDARMDDGFLDLCVAGKVSRLRMLGFVPQFMRGSHTRDSKITMARGHQVSVTSESPWAAHVDGEIYGVGARYFSISLLPKRLRLRC
jgi:diacylglycerol kinase (ATP)